MQAMLKEQVSHDPAILERAGSIANDLLGDIERRIADPDARHAALLDRVLAYAAKAEQRIAEQERRIAFLEGLSSTDELTGLLNRRGFTHQLNRVLATARRYGETGVLIYCDLDNLKQVNDGWGHAAGDDLIRAAANTFLTSVRESDVVGRLGGDEFGVILLQTTFRNGAKRARTLQWLIDRTRIAAGGVEVLVKASMGVEPYGPEDTAEDLLRRADMAMYDIKRRKRTGSPKIAAE
jgi:diguanylate cyclase (GGDEF)-like protein